MKPILVFVGACTFLLTGPLGPGQVSASGPGSRLPTDELTITHVLSRMAFGPRAGDVDRVKGIGLERYIDQQLHPERIQDTAVADRLAGLSTISMSRRELSEKFEQPLMDARREQKQQADGEAPKVPAPVQQRANSVVAELGEQKILRAVYSERQLQEVLTDFWFNHFNVDARKGRDRFLLTDYERDVIRPHVLGSFRDLLGATAKSPAMLFYLDNWMSVDPNGPHPIATPPHHARGPFGGAYVVPGSIRQPPRGKNAKGLNENYGRELLELHTLGVDGGYTQRDVTEVARAFTGWTIETRSRAAGSCSAHNCTTWDRRSCSATSSRQEAANRTAKGCSTSSPSIRRRRASSRRSSHADS